MFSNFNLNSSKVYTGLDGKLQIFDISGELEKEIKLTDSRKAKEGLKGLISGIEFNPDYSGLYGVCSLRGGIGLYDERNHDCFGILREGSEVIKEKRGGQSACSGISQIEWSKDGNYLWSSSRNSNHLTCWDIRGTGQVLFTLPREGLTNQRLYFSVTDDGVIFGDIEGAVWKAGRNQSLIEVYRDPLGRSVSNAKMSRNESNILVSFGQREYVEDGLESGSQIILLSLVDSEIVASP